LIDRCHHRILCRAWRAKAGTKNGRAECLRIKAAVSTTNRLEMIVSIDTNTVSCRRLL
jgi:hypothetical protein